MGPVARLMETIEKPRRFAQEPMYRCAACVDTGMQALTSGSHDVSHDIGRHVLVTATPERPVYRRCRGAFETTCPFRVYQGQEAAKRAQVSGRRRDEAL
jgi:hypothetical protein